MSSLLASCCALFSCYHRETCSFLKGKEEQLIWGEVGWERTLGGGKGGEAVVRMYCMRQE